MGDFRFLEQATLHGAWGIAKSDEYSQGSSPGRSYTHDEIACPPSLQLRTALVGIFMELASSGPVQIFEVDWQQDDVRRAGWRLSAGLDPGPTRMFSCKQLLQVPGDLRHPDIFKSFRSLTKETSEFLDWWYQMCGDKGDKVFLLRFPERVWDIPWELLVEGLLEHLKPTVCLARSTPVQIDLAPAHYDEPLRILVLQGDSGAAIGHPLDLDGEYHLLKDAWENLDLTVQRCIELPRLQTAVLDTLPEVLKREKPHILWFSGHGRAEPTSALLFAGNTWVEATALAQAIQKSGWAPIYAVFWACDTAQANHGGTVDVTPVLFESLQRVGVVALLAMQAPVRDCSARLMARDLFAYLAIGLPLEQALSRVRANLLASPPQGGHPYDWASPVVWSAARLVRHLYWNSQEQLNAQAQVFGRQALRRRAASAAMLNDSATGEERRRARLWRDSPRIWVYSPTGAVDDAAHQYFWLRTLQALSMESPAFVLPLSIATEALDEQVQRWAEEQFRRLLPGDTSIEIVQALLKVSNSAPSGWKSLCALQGVCLAITLESEPRPQAPESGWFWQPILVEDTRPAVIMLSGMEPAMEPFRHWTIDRMGDPPDTEHIRAAVKQAPRLTKALALLDLPLDKAYLAITTEDGANSLERWPLWERLFIDTSAGPLMLTGARRCIMADLNPEQRLQAHRDCVEILGHPALPLDTKLRERRLTHLVAAGFKEQALDEANILCDVYQQEGRPLAVLAVLARIRLWQLELPHPARLVAAWAYLQRGKLGQAKIWLDRANPGTPLARAYRHGLRAEWLKSSGSKHSKQQALTEIDHAIQACEEALTDPALTVIAKRKLRSYQQDRARIQQYLFYELDEAAAEYESLALQWRDEPDAGLDLAVVKRNWAGCLRTLATSANDTQMQKALRLLREARTLAEKHPQSFVLPEILYELAGVEEASSLPNAPKSLTDCIDAARRSYHLMLLAIAESRKFWQYDKQFSLARWESLEEALEVFPQHGWAIRTAINGRLRVARYLAAQSELVACQVKLDENWRVLKNNPSFDQGSDQRRIVQTFAGLWTLTGREQNRESFWTELLKTYPVLETYSHSTNLPPAGIWEQVSLPKER